MMRDEFNDLVWQIHYDLDHDVEFVKYPDEDEYGIIEKVYCYHPLFDGDNAKSKAAWLYVTFGMPIFRILLPKAEELKILEDEVFADREEWGYWLAQDERTEKVEANTRECFEVWQQAEKKLEQARAEVC